MKMKSKNDFKFEEYRNILKINTLIYNLEQLSDDKIVSLKIY